ncbi:YggS family pyridoxal phosphate-dependent enzyme [Rhodococcus sp. NPDC058521]|uniref:YggS family pyridoxal phosphate-dependent enzyme n=1 Tax=Rhodococcus sp. NPDC058521 TaxID=3346536 RepID=UPI00364A8B10
MNTAQDADRSEEIAAALTSVRERLTAACTSAGRDPAEVQLLPVTKFFPESDVRILYDLGCREFGESREQEATAKVDEFAKFRADSDVRWHMIGHLQRNKAKAIARWAYAIHSVDSPRLVTSLDKAVSIALDEGQRTAPLEVLVQVSLDGDPHRGGVPVAELEELAAQVESRPALRLSGLMAVPPLGSDAEQEFERLASVRRDFLVDHPHATNLSSGMTNDLEHAVRHGSTCVRVGTALLGARPITSR